MTALRNCCFVRKKHERGWFTTYFCVLGVDAPCACLGYGPWFEAEGEMTDAHAALVRTPCLDHILPPFCMQLGPCGCLNLMQAARLGLGMDR